MLVEPVVSTAAKRFDASRAGSSGAGAAQRLGGRADLGDLDANLLASEHPAHVSSIRARPDPSSRKVLSLVDSMTIGQRSRAGPARTSSRRA